MSIQVVIDVLRSVGGQALCLADYVAWAVEQAALGRCRRGIDGLDPDGGSVRQRSEGVENDDAVLNVAGQGYGRNAPIAESVTVILYRVHGLRRRWLVEAWNNLTGMRERLDFAMGIRGNIGPEDDAAETIPFPQCRRNERRLSEAGTEAANSRAFIATTGLSQRGLPL